MGACPCMHRRRSGVHLLPFSRTPPTLGCTERSALHRMLHMVKHRLDIVASLPLELLEQVAAPVPQAAKANLDTLQVLRRFDLETILAMRQVSRAWRFSVDSCTGAWTVRTCCPSHPRLTPASHPSLGITCAHHVAQRIHNTWLPARAARDGSAARDAVLGYVRRQRGFRFTRGCHRDLAFEGGWIDVVGWLTG
jgi:hypothetical protein